MKVFERRRRRATLCDLVGRAVDVIRRVVFGSVYGNVQGRGTHGTIGTGLA